MQIHTRHTLHLITYLQEIVHYSTHTPTHTNKHSYHFILCNKMVCELLAHSVITANAYESIAYSICPLLHEEGVFLLLDVTTKDVHSGLFYPQLMNRELNRFVLEQRHIATLLPLSCTYNPCKEGYFMQQTFYIDHSHKKHDASRICYRILYHKTLQASILPSTLPAGKHIIYSAGNNKKNAKALCNKQSKGENAIDSFNINQ